MRSSEISIIEICNNLQHSLYNSLQDSNDLFDKFAKIITVCSSTCGSQPNPASKIFFDGFDTILSLRIQISGKEVSLNLLVEEYCQACVLHLDKNHTLKMGVPFLQSYKTEKVCH